MNDKKEQTFFQRLVNLVPGSSAPSCSFWFRALADLLFPWALPRNSGHARLFRAKGKPENRECLTPMQPTFFAQNNAGFSCHSRIAKLCVLAATHSARCITYHIARRTNKRSSSSSLLHIPYLPSSDKTAQKTYQATF